MTKLKNMPRGHLDGCKCSDCYRVKAHNSEIIDKPRDLDDQGRERRDRIGSY